MEEKSSSKERRILVRKIGEDLSRELLSTF
jgi:hypothetical protein